MKLIISEIEKDTSKMKKILVVTTVLFLIKTGSAFALPFLSTNLDIDFRDAPWSGAFGQTSHTVGDVTASANSGSRNLYQDSTDGLGHDMRAAMPQYIEAFGVPGGNDLNVNLPLYW